MRFRMQSLFHVPDPTATPPGFALTLRVAPVVASFSYIAGSEREHRAPSVVVMDLLGNIIRNISMALSNPAHKLEFMAQDHVLKHLSIGSHTVIMQSVVIDVKLFSPS